MILDYDDELTTTGGQAITATAIGTKVKDGGAARDWGAGELLVPYLRVPAAFNTLTSLTVTIEGADNAGLSTNPVVLATKTILLAALTANSLHSLPPLLAGYKKRFLGARFTVTGTNPTTGSVVVGFVDKDGRPQDNVNAL